MEIIIPAVVGVVCLAAGGIGGFMYRKNISEARAGKTEEAVKKLMEDAQLEAETLKKETLIEAKEEAHRVRQELDQEIRDRRSEMQRSERRIQQKEDQLDKKNAQLEAKEDKLNRLREQTTELEARTQELFEKQTAELERISGLTADEARQSVMQQAEQDARHDAALMLRDVERETKAESDRIARDIISGAIQRCAADHVAESTVSVVALPNEDMKGRIIGREGRNIRALETATGIDFIIDDTPEAVILSGFDPVRREIARLALEKLVADGRIHPTRIEEMVVKARKEVENQIRETGESTVFELGITGIHTELVKSLGRLRYRTSYGQNVLNHSMEVANLAGLMAAEVGADVRTAKRAGLLHDIGKAIDHEVEGSHVKIGVDLAKKYREHNDIIHAIASHHNDTEPTTVIDLLVQAADAISGARPGARRETLESYIKRLEKLEEIANSFEGVEKSFAIQAGREVRIGVIPEKVDDAGIVLMARDVAHRIESEMEYPGQIKVTVLRETRASDLAK